MILFHGVPIQQPGGRLTTLDHFLHGKDNGLSLLMQLFILFMDFSFLHIMFVPKPQFMDLQNALFTVMAFSTVLLLHSQGSTTVGT